MDEKKKGTPSKTIAFHIIFGHKIFQKEMEVSCFWKK